MATPDMKSDAQSSEKLNNSKRRGGGRPQSEGWYLYSFTKVDGDKGKCLAKCMKCLKVLQNTSLIRMANHRKRCGLLDQTAAVEINNSKFEEEVEQPIVWESQATETQLVEFIDETPVIQAVENVQQTRSEIINEDIQRHRKPRSKFGSVETALSSFLIDCNLSFDIVDSSHFKNFVNALNSDYNVPSSSQLKALTLSKLKAADETTSRKRRRNDYASSSD